MTRFVITGHARTGSSYLLRMLNTHPCVQCLGEVFNNPMHGPILAKISNPVEYLERQFCYQKSHNGFKLLADQARQSNLAPVWSHVAKNYKAIILFRRNRLNRYLSEQLVYAHNTPERQAWSDVPFVRPVYLNPQDCIADFCRKEVQEQQLRSLFKDNGLFLYYEELKPDESSYGRILSFLGLDWVKPSTTMLKQRQKPQQAMISNYLELKHVLAGTVYESYLDETEVRLL